MGKNQTVFSFNETFWTFHNVALSTYDAECVSHSPTYCSCIKSYDADFGQQFCECVPKVFFACVCVRHL